jgi:hypothetical protein
MPATKKANAAAATPARLRDASGRFTMDRGLPDGVGFQWAMASSVSARQCPAAISTGKRPVLIDQQKMRNNWSKVPLPSQIEVCRRVAAENWFVRGVAELRIPSVVAGFKLIPRLGGVPAGEPVVVGVGPSAVEGYDFASLVFDIATEEFIASNVVALWRKGSADPVVTILDGERVGYRSCGGLERITLKFTADLVMKRDTANKQTYILNLGQRVYDAQCQGKEVTIVKGLDPDWEFEVMAGGKRRGVFATPELVGILDDLDWMELMKAGDWNLGWFRQQVIRIIRKGYAVTVGQGAGVNSVDMTDKERDNLGEGFSKVVGAGNAPVNHDVAINYLTIPPENFDPKQVNGAIDRLLFWGGIEAVALFGSFSQQNGASPSLMRNLRVRIQHKRERIVAFLRRIFAHEEFASLRVETYDFDWSVKGLYSMEELLNLVRGTAGGVASPQSRRKWLDLDNAEESRLMKEAHADRTAHTPPFEEKQALVAPQFPQDFPGGKSSQPAGPEGDPGRPPVPDPA